MALFRKKDKSAESDGEVVVKSERKARKGGGRSRNEQLVSVFSETVMEQAVSEMRDLAPFQLKLGKNLYHAIWVLEADSIGGLNKKMRQRGTDQGELIQRMTSGGIKYVLTPSMNESNYIGFIMDRDTFDAMNEFSILDSAQYNVAYISDADPANRIAFDKGAKVTLADAGRVLDGADLATLLKDAGSELLADARDTGTAQPEGPSEDFSDNSLDISAPSVSVERDEAPLDEVDGEGFDMGSDDDIDSTIDETDADDLAAIEAAMAEEEAAASDDSPIAYDAYTANQMDISREAAGNSFGRAEGEVYQEAASEVPQAQGTPMTTDEVVAASEDAANFEAVRRYFTSDLGLEIDDDAFVAQFQEGVDVAWFDEDRGEGMLKEYLSEMSKIANDELAQVRSEHRYLLRERYMRMLSLFADSIVADYDLSSTDNEYGKAYAQLIDKFGEEMSDEGITRRSLERRNEYKAEFESRVQAEREAAAARAENAYRERHVDEYRAALRDIEDQARANIEQEHVAELNRLNEIRRLAARKDFDLGRTRIMEAIARQQAAYIQNEDELYRYHLDAMSRWIDDNRKDDIAYAETMREQQRQLEEAERVQREYMARIEVERDQFTQQKSRLEAELEEVKQRNENFLDDLNRRHGLDIDAMQVRYDELQQKLEEQIRRTEAVAEEKDAEWAERLEEAREDARLEHKRYTKLAKQNNSVNLMWVALAIVIAVATFFIGMILGLRQSIDYSSAVAVQNATQQNVTGTTGTVIAYLGE